jgi:hypothetical protein
MVTLSKRSMRLLILRETTYVEALELMSLESVGVGCDLLNDLGLGQRLNCHYFYLNDTTTNQYLVN